MVDHARNAALSPSRVIAAMWTPPFGTERARHNGTLTTQLTFRRHGAVIGADGLQLSLILHYFWDDAGGGAAGEDGAHGGRAREGRRKTARPSDRCEGNS
ncbi:hypothetical protein GCM10011428_45350 [Streptomyces violaceus]